MVTAAEQYRALVAKLEAINPSSTILEVEDTSAPTPADALAPAGSTASTSSGTVNPDKYKPNDNIPEIKANSLAQAKQIALKQLGAGKKFRFCMTYGTKMGPARPTPSGMEKPQDNWSRYGGTNVLRPVKVSK